MSNQNVVILGTAHGANVAGKRSPDGRFREYRFSRDMVDMIKLELEKQGYKVYVDITADNVLLPQAAELRNRVNIVNKYCKMYGLQNCIYVSVHVNAAKSDGAWHNASGVCVFVSNNASEKSKRLAKIFTSNALRNDLCGNRSIPSSKYWTANLYVLRNTYCPAVLTENMFQDNLKDVEFLMSDKGRRAICDLHVQTINEYFKTL